jgi:hypothetical protein
MHLRHTAIQNNQTLEGQIVPGIPNEIFVYGGGLIVMWGTAIIVFGTRHMIRQLCQFWRGEINFEGLMAH